MRYAVALIALALTLVPPSATATDRTARGGDWIAFVAAEDDDALVVVDLGSGGVRTRLDVPDGPHNVAATPATVRTPYVLVTSPPAGRVTLVDPRGLRVLKVFGGFGYPHDVEVEAGGRYAYVTDERRGQVAVLSLTRRRVVARIAVGARPHDLAVSASGRLIWVTHGPRQRYLTVLAGDRPSHPTVVRRIETAFAPHDIAAAAGRFWVTFWKAPYVEGYDTIRERRVMRFRAGMLPHHVAVDEDLASRGGARVWVTDHAGGRVRVWATHPFRLLRSVAVGPHPHHVSAFGGPAVVAVHDSGRIRFVYPNRSRHYPGGGHDWSTWVGHGLHGVVQVVV